VVVTGNARLAAGGLARLLFRLLLGRRLPRTKGRLAVPGLAAPLRIARDAWGVPSIQAETEEDAWFGLGFCQGQDRAFQLELLLRTVRGTLAELFGVEALPIDRLVRRIGFREAGARCLAELAPARRQSLDAFARGVRAGVAVGTRRRAHEFVLLRAQPTPFEPADALALIMLQGFVLESNWAAELARLLVAMEDGTEALLALDPLAAAAAAAGSVPAAARLAEDAARLADVLGARGGSNVWAVSGWRTATGRPLLAADPHLGPFLPSPWYLAVLRTPGWSVAGASFVGAPGFGAGHNGRLAWGVTAGLADDTDLVREELGTDGRSVRRGAAFVPCAIRRETIRVRGAAPVEETVLVTPEGPVIGPALEGEAGALSLRATWLAPRADDGLFALPHAGSVGEARAAFARGSMLSLGVALADTTGAIARQMVGDMPRRRRSWGTLPLPGRDAEGAWDAAPLEFAALPHAIDPAEGFVVSANNPPDPEQAFGFIGLDWLDAYRHDRIAELLAQRVDWDLAGMQALQMDQYALPWRAIAEIVLALPCVTPAARAAQALLRDWDGTVGADSPAAAVFELFLVELARRVVRAKAPRSAERLLGRGFTPLLPLANLAVRCVAPLVRLLRAQPAGWFARSWAEECADMLDAVAQHLAATHGERPEGWAWGRVRPVTFRHPLGRRWPLGRIFDRGPFPCGGDTNTVCQASVDPFDPLANPLYLPSLRVVMDVGDWDAMRVVLPGGQSGNPLSAHYDDLLALWRRGEGIALAWSAAEIARRAQSELVLLPVQ
jgi:penicillin amidase